MFRIIRELIRLPETRNMVEKMNFKLSVIIRSLVKKRPEFQPWTDIDLPKCIMCNEECNQCKEEPECINRTCDDCEHFELCEQITWHF